MTVKPFWKKAALELDFEIGEGMIQTEHRCVQEGGLGKSKNRGAFLERGPDL